MKQMSTNHGKGYAYIQDSDCSRSFMPYLPRNLVRDRYMW